MEDLEERAQRLLQVAQGLATRIRVDDPTDVKATVAAIPPGEVADLVMILAALVPAGRPVPELLQWWVNPTDPGLRPCGTHSAYARHLANGEKPCWACENAEREYQAESKRRRRADMNRRVNSKRPVLNQTVPDVVARQAAATQQTRRDWARRAQLLIATTALEAHPGAARMEVDDAGERFLVVDDPIGWKGALEDAEELLAILGLSARVSDPDVDCGEDAVAHVLQLPVTPAPRPDPVEDWRHQALCRDLNPEPDDDPFFPVGTTGPALAEIEDAKAVCAACPVRAECLEWALGREEHGVWGGTTPDERRALRGDPTPVVDPDDEDGLEEVAA